mgnify:CR=1 FL=1|tara:strand:+ start:1714 stop:1893 length:180 start_codon:yes stop_codon:yes gene_type:complete
MSDSYYKYMGSIYKIVDDSIYSYCLGSWNELSPMIQSRAISELQMGTLLTKDEAFLEMI